MTSKAKFENEVEKHHATYQDDSADIIVDAPQYFVWADGGVHTLQQTYSNGAQSFKASAYDELISRMESGTEPCEDIDCDICNEAENEWKSTDIERRNGGRRFLLDLEELPSGDFRDHGEEAANQELLDEI